MIKKENYEVELDDKNKINIRIIKEHNKLVKFAINLSSYLNGKWHAVYRVDNYHGFLHEQKLWRTKNRRRLFWPKTFPPTKRKLILLPRKGMALAIPIPIVKDQ